MPSLKLIADDLTGALDTAAEFVGLCGPLAVTWNDALVGSLSSFALDTGTREHTTASAVAHVSKAAPLLEGAHIAFKKVDSLLRGSWAEELAACVAVGNWRHCVFAPAFPHHGRRTLDGRQWTRNAAGEWHDVAGDLVVCLRSAGAPAALGRTGEELRGGITIFDAETDADLQEIVSLAGSAESVLWCGTGGLARALARSRHTEPNRRLASPVLGFFGSDQGVTRRQIERCRPYWLTIGGQKDIAEVNRRLGADGVALVDVELPPVVGRQDASARIALAFAELVNGMAKPGTLIVAGGETLRAACTCLGATSLEVVGQIEPGLPRSVLRGGRWDGVDVISKSGAFGDQDLWRDLLIENGLFDPNVRL
jgi:D-threonate/D-erythronate kinase